jgi:hypothetical protein
LSFPLAFPGLNLSPPSVETTIDRRNLCLLCTIGSKRDHAKIQKGLGLMERGQYQILGLLEKK